MERTAAPDRHTMFEDAQAIITACAFFSLGLALLRQAGLLMGGTPGIALVIARVTHLSFGWIYFFVNLPFLLLGVRGKGWPFLAKTFAAVALLSFATERLSAVLAIGSVHPAYAAVMGGALAGVGLLMLFRHDASLGGVGILAVWLQERHGWRAGVVQLAIDGCILVASMFIASRTTLALSIVGAAALNMVLAINHRPGRYMGA